MRTSLLSIVLVLLCSATFAQVPLVRDGKANLVIVTAAQPAPPEQRAAGELRATLASIAGTEFTILTDAQDLPPAAVVIGQTRFTSQLAGQVDLTKLTSDGFVLKSQGQRLLLLGGSPRGTMYAATALLEKLGVRYYTPKITRIPRNPAAVIPALDETQIPAFEYREPYFTEAFEKEWAAHLMANGQSQRLDASTGGKITYYPFVHSFETLIPKSLFDAHPEYFPVLKGKRSQGDPRRQQDVQRCLSNPELLKLAIETVNKWITARPQAMIYSVSQNDCHNFCECDACKAIEARYGNTHSGLYLWFVNQIAEAIEKDHPDKLIDTLAYQFTEAAPTGIVPRKNVRVRLCPIAVCEAHPYDKCSAKPTVAFMKALDAWGKITDTLYIWHYNTDFAHYLMPFPDFDQFPQTIRLYRQHGVRGIFFEGAYGPGGGGSDADLRSYVMAKLAWNPDLESRPLIEEWMASVYGPAKGPMLAWFDALHAAVRTPDKHLFIYDPPTAHFLTPELLGQGDQLFDQAEKLAANDAVTSEYIAKARLCLRYVKIARNPKANPDLEPFLADLKKFGIGQIREGQNVDVWAQAMRAKK